MIEGRAFAPAALFALVAACSQGRDPGTISCAVGETLEIGCASACGLGSCTGDAVLRVCDGALADVRACADAVAVLRESDDACGSLCPRLSVTCPPSGRLTVVHRAYRDEPSTCDWQVRVAPPSAGVTAAPLDVDASR